MLLHSACESSGTLPQGSPREPTLRVRSLLALAIPFLFMGLPCKAFAGSGPVALDSVTLARSINEFSFNLYRATESDPSEANRFLSPFSVYGALLMAMVGAEGQTAEQMGRVLQFPAELYDSKDQDSPWDTGPVHAGFRALGENLSESGTVSGQDSLELEYRIREKQQELDSLLAQQGRLAANAIGDSLVSRKPAVSSPFDDYRERDEVRLPREIRNLRREMQQYELAIANGLWVDQRVSLQPRFRDMLRDTYNSPPRTLDFQHAAPAAIDSINAWAMEHTQRRIDNVATPVSITEDTRVALANAVYFKGLWQNEFDPRETRDGRFMTLAGDTVKTRFMDQSESAFAYGRFNLKEGRLVADPEWNKAPARPHSGSVQLLVMPYRGRELEMWVLLPENTEVLGELEQLLDADLLDSCVTDLHSITLPVAMPRFEFRQMIDLKTALNSLGMTDAFGVPGNGFTAMYLGSGPLYLDSAMQSTFVQVNERGTEAAAVTLLDGIPLRGMGGYKPYFRADRPFLFMIRHRDTGAALFIGRMGNPAEAVLADETVLPVQSGEMPR